MLQRVEEPQGHETKPLHDLSVSWGGVLPKLGATLFRLIEKVAKQISDERGAF